MKTDLKCAVCAVVRLENLYIKEWVEHYKELGFDNIILYDNNNPDEDDLNDVIGDYIKSGYVIIINVKGLKGFQVHAYNHCINMFKNKFDWIGFFDIDEFLTLTEHNTIQEYLNTFEDTVDSIAFNWMIYGDNDLVYYEDKPVKERFKEPNELNICNGYDFPENDHIKVIINTGKNKNIRFKWTPHSIENTKDPRTADNKKREDPLSPFNHNAVYNPAYIKHYYSKTIDEFYRFKYKRGCPDIDKNPYTFDRFFKINKKTPEKLEYIKKLKDD